MIDTLITGLVLAFVSAVTLVAYKHPGGFRRNFFSLINFISIPAMVIVLWGVIDIVVSAGVIHGISISNPTFPLSSIATYAAKLHAALKQIGVTFIVYLGSVAYLFLLRQLPDLLKEKSEN